MYKLAKRGLSAFAVSAILSGAAFAGDLVINFDDPNPAPKAGFEAAVEAFNFPPTHLTSQAGIRAIGWVHLWTLASLSQSPTFGTLRA